MPKKKPATPKPDQSPPDPLTIEAQILNANQLNPPPLTKATPPSVSYKPKQRQAPIPKESFKPKKRIIDKLMDPDNHYLAEIREKVEQGASKATIDAILMMPPGTIDKLLDKGKDSKDPKCKYKKFYLLYRKWAGQARSVAETTTLHKTPEKWMDRNSSNKLLESEEDRNIIQSQPLLTQGHQSGVTPQQLLASLKILQEQGISIDEALAKDAIVLDHQPQVEDTEDE